MTKRQLIDEILTINGTAKPRFLAQFDDGQLNEYLTHLQVLETPRLTGDASRYEKYFRNCPTVPVHRPQWRTDTEPAAPVTVEDLDEFAEDYKQGEGEPLQPTYAQTSDLPGNEAVEPDGFGSELDDGASEWAGAPAFEVVEQHEQPTHDADELLLTPEETDLEPVARQPEADEPNEADEAHEHVEDEPASATPEPAAVAAATAARPPASPFADTEEDSESWLY